MIYLTWVVFKKWAKLNNFLAFPYSFYNNFHLTESGKRMSDFGLFKNFGLAYIRV
jgi:hypothetical protein